MLKEIFVDVHMGLFVLVQIMHLVSGGDDGPWDYSSFGRWVPPQRPIMHFAGDSGSGTIPQMRRSGRVTNVGAQPPFLQQGQVGIAPPYRTPFTHYSITEMLPPCVNYPSISYCTADTEYPLELVSSCMMNDVSLFKILRTRVLWSCEEFPDELLPAEEPTVNPGEIPAETEEAGVAEAYEPIIVTPAPRATQPTRAPPRERLIKVPEGPPKQTARTRIAKVRNARDDSSASSFSRFIFPSRTNNHTYEVCPSVIKSAVGIVRAQADNGEWMPLVRMGNCKQVIRTEECVRAGEPCRHLCSYLKSQCVQRFGLQQMLTCTTDRGLHLQWFRIPSSCGCNVEFSEQSTTPDPNSDRK